MNTQPRIYDYYDYRRYLGDVCSYFKGQKVSMRSMAKTIGVSNAYLTMVLNRKRNLDLKYHEAFSNYLKLNVSERSYFQNLIVLNDSEDSKKRSEAFKNLSKFRSYRSGKSEDVVTHKYLNHWHYVAIRELSFLPDFKEEPEWIQKRFLAKLKLREIEEALKFLKKHHLLSRHNESAFDCSESIYKLSLTHFHQEMLKIAGESIEKTERENRNITGFTKSMSKKNFSKASAILREAAQKLEALEEEEEGAELYHFYFLGFPLTKKEVK